MAAVEGFERAQRAWHTDAEAAEHRLAEGARTAIDEEAVRRCRRGRRLASIVALKGLAPRVPVQDEGAAADPGGLRLDQIEHQLHGHRGIGGIAPGAQHRKASVHSGPIGRRDHEGFCGPELDTVAPGRQFRRGRAVLGPRGRQRQHGRQERGQRREEGRPSGSEHGLRGP